MDEIARLHGVSARTVERDWRTARAWLASRLAEGPESG
jgi:DNA-directed RNA polymerase specialized sigma24 family protein